jgi:hypothetical protein
VVEKEEERKTSPENVWLICKVEDMYHERNHWYNFVRIGLYHKHYKGSTYNDLIEWYNGEKANDAFNVKVADDLVALMEFLKEAQLFPFHDGMNPFPVVTILLWHQMFSSLKRPMEAEADTWIPDYKDSLEYKALHKYSTHSKLYYPAVYCVCGG